MARGDKEREMVGEVGGSRGGRQGGDGTMNLKGCRLRYTPALKICQKARFRKVEIMELRTGTTKQSSWMPPYGEVDNSVF